MSLVVLSLAGALAPVAFMLHFVYVRDKYEREPLGLVSRVYFISFLTVIPAIILEIIGQSALDSSSPQALLYVALLTFVIVAGAEEGSKYVFLRWLAFKRPEFNEPYDGIVYGVAVSLGFATVENIGYVFSAVTLDERVSVLIGRALLAVPGHALWGVMMGYFIGRAKFAPDPPTRGRMMRNALLLPIFFHGLYNFNLIAATEGIGGSGALVLFTIAFVTCVVAAWVVAARMIGRLQADSPFKRPSPLVHPIAAFNPGYKFCTQCGTRAPRADQFCRQCGATWPQRTANLTS